jgi:hypothetical protein
MTLARCGAGLMKQFIHYPGMHLKEARPAENFEIRVSLANN